MVTKKVDQERANLEEGVYCKGQRGKQGTALEEVLGAHVKRVANDKQYAEEPKSREKAADS